MANKESWMHLELAPFTRPSDKNRYVYEGSHFELIVKMLAMVSNYVDAKTLFTIAVRTAVFLTKLSPADKLDNRVTGFDAVAFFMGKDSMRKTKSGDTIHYNGLLELVPQMADVVPEGDVKELYDGVIAHSEKVYTGKQEVRSTEQM